MRGRFRVHRWRNASIPVYNAIALCWQASKAIIARRWKFIQYLCVALAFFFIGTALYANWDSLSSLKREVNYLWFTLSSSIAAIAILSLAVWWTLSVRCLQNQSAQRRLGWKHGVRIWAVAQLARYLPGGIWNYVGRAYACAQAGVSKSCTALSLAIEAVLRVQAAIIVFLTCLPLWPVSEWSDTELFLAVGLLLAGFLVLKPGILNRGINVVLQIWRRSPINMPSLKHKCVLALLTGHVLTVAVAGSAFYLMVISVYYVPISAALPMTGMLAIAVIIGFLNPLTPHGLGTREGLLILLLNYYLPLPIAIVVSLLARLWLTISELMGILVVALVFRAGENADALEHCITPRGY